MELELKLQSDLYTILLIEYSHIEKQLKKSSTSRRQWDSNPASLESKLHDPARIQHCRPQSYVVPSQLNVFVLTRSSIFLRKA